MNSFILNITASSGEFYQGSCESMVLPVKDGVYGVQAGHSPVLVAIHMGMLKFTVDGETREILVGDGIAEVTPTFVLLLVDSAERPEDIDKNRAEAARIRERIGATNAVCYDMSCACSGCVYGLSTADLIMAGAAFARQEAARTGTPLRCNDVRRVLVVAAERLSKLVDWEERATCILFGDGAGAVVLEWRDEAETGAAGAAGAAGADAPGILSSYMENTDDVDRTLWCDSAFASREVPFAADGTTAAGASATATPRLAASDAESDPYMRMAGQAVFKFATSAMMRCTEEALTRAGLTTDDVTLFTPHQANERIIRYAAKKMDLPMERFQVIIDHVGNVSGASALIALNEALCEGKLQPGDIACMTAFGGGLTAGSCVIRI